MELEEFTVSLVPFQKQELPLVYAEYQIAHDLKTEYEDLDPTVRNASRNPLVLRLMAKIHRGKAIPDNGDTDAHSCRIMWRR